MCHPEKFRKDTSDCRVAINTFSPSACQCFTELNLSRTQSIVHDYMQRDNKPFDKHISISYSPTVEL